MNDIDSFLKDCVYYPCSGLHGVPVRLLGKRFQRFFYADYSVDRNQFESSISNAGFKGYQLSAREDLAPELVFGMSWKEFAQRHHSTTSRVPIERSNPFVALCRFKREMDFNDDHGPLEFELMFARCEAIATFVSAFSQRNVAPKCLVYIRSGIGFGGNFSEYPRDLRSALLSNSSGLPSFMFYDAMGSNSNCGDYLDLVKNYEQIERWGYPDGGHLTLAGLIASDGKQGTPSDGLALTSLLHARG